MEESGIVGDWSLAVADEQQPALPVRPLPPRADRIREVRVPPRSGVSQEASRLRCLGESVGQRIVGVAMYAPPGFGGLLLVTWPVV